MIADGSPGEILAGRLVLRHRGRSDRRARAGDPSRRGRRDASRAPTREDVARRRDDSVANRDLRASRARAAGRLRLVRADATGSRTIALVAALAALAVAGGWCSPPIPNVQATTDVVLITGFAVGAAPGLRRRSARRADLQPVARPGAVDTMGDGRLGAGRTRRRRAGGPDRSPARAPRARRRVRRRRPRLRGAPRLLGARDERRCADARSVSRDRLPRRAVQRRPRRRQLRPRPRRRARARQDHPPLPRALRVHLASRVGGAGRGRGGGPGRARDGDAAGERERRRARLPGS